MEKTTQRKIEYHFKNYNKLKKSAVQSTVDWATENMATDYSRERVQTSPSNYREEILCRLIDSSSEALRWALVIDKVIDHYKFENKSRMIIAHYFMNETIRKTCRIVGISSKTYFNWKNEIFDLTERWARELRII